MDDDPHGLQAGDHHYAAYVGPAESYDVMGATQFRLLTTLGLRAGHRVLDFGCGSLRAGRFLISYLDPGGYHGVEPNRWLIDEAVGQVVGADLLAVKRPVFDHNDHFEVVHLGADFDAILAQSIFSHTGPAVAAKLLGEFAAVLRPGGRVAATFVEGPDRPDAPDWVYPDVCTFRPATIRRLAADAGLTARRIPWYHPRQTWYVLAREPGALPSWRMRRRLRGAVLFAPEFDESWRWPARWWFTARRLLRRHLPRRLFDLASPFRR